jgi:hypothetical protein
MDLNDVKAGKYQLVAARWDQITSKPGEPLDYIRHRRGAILDLTAEDAKRLVAAGAVVKPGQLEKEAADRARAAAEQAAANYQAILAELPEDVRAEVAPETVAKDEGPKAGSVEFIVAEVGDDVEKAKAALAAETGEGGKSRPGLVKKLQAVIDAGQGSNSGQGGDGQQSDGTGGGA